MAADVVGDLPSSFPKHRVCALGGPSSESNGKEDQRVRIQPPDLCFPEDAPFRHDRLERQESVEVLTRIVSQIEGPCVLALDAPWGYGKTTFLKMWEAWLRQEAQGFPVVACFNAWKTDFTNHPFLALSSELTKELESCPKTAENPALNRLKCAGKQLLRVAVPAAIPLLAGTELPVDGVAVGAVVEAVSSVWRSLRRDQYRFNDYKKAEEAIASFKDALGKLAQGLGQPLVIMIDELDRCRPSYAIELLEVAKYLFAVDNVVFVLAVNRAELVHSVKALYGTCFDAEGYLRRFFDLDFQLPEPGRAQFVEDLLETTRLTSVLGTRESQEERQTAITLLVAFLCSPELSLRDIQQVVHRLALMLVLLPANAVLQSFNAVVAIILRTVDPVVYQKFVVGEATDDEVMEVVFRWQTALLRSDDQLWEIESRIILGSLTMKPENRGRDFSELKSPLLNRYRSWENAERPGNELVRNAIIYLARLQDRWEVMNRPDFDWRSHMFLETIRRLELLSPELGEDGST